MIKKIFIILIFTISLLNSNFISSASLPADKYYKIQVSQKEWRDKRNITINKLNNAARTNDSKVIKELLDSGRVDYFPIEAAFELSCENGSKEAAELLYNKIKELNYGDHCYNLLDSPALIKAVINRKYEIIKILHGINPNFSDNSGRTPLMFACLLNDLKMVKLLLEFEGIDVKSENLKNNKMTALDIAHQIGNKEIINLLRNHIGYK